MDLETPVEHGQSETMIVLQEVYVDDSDVIRNYKVDSNVESGFKTETVTLSYLNIGVWRSVSSRHDIPTVGSMVQDIATCGLCGHDDRERFDVLKGVSGILKPKTMTLLLGPPGCGRSLFMKLLSQRVSATTTESTIEGEIYLNGSKVGSDYDHQANRFVDYVDQKEIHAALLTVEETLRYAWMCSAGRNVVEQAKDVKQEANKAVQRMLEVLGLRGCKDSFVGDESLRGISGGEKRRLTLGEMLITPRPVKIMDSITDGLDAATALDVLRYLRTACNNACHTYLVALQQTPPAIYELFDEVILMSEGQILYHGPRSKARAYFESLGFYPLSESREFTEDQEMNELEFLQEIATIKGSRFYHPSNSTENFEPSYAKQHHCAFLAQSWRDSIMNQDLISSIHFSNKILSQSPKSSLLSTTTTYFMDLSSWWFFFCLVLVRFWDIEKRSKSYYIVRLVPTIIIAAFTGSIYKNMAMDDLFTMTGYLYVNEMMSAIGLLSYIPRLYMHQHWHNKFTDAAFYPTSAYTLSHTFIAYPLFTLETVVQSSIIYWIAGLSADEYGARFGFFNVAILMMTLCLATFFRCIVIKCAKPAVGVACCGVVILIYSVFSGFVQPINATPVYWQWFFYINPIYWTLSALSINEYKSSRYDKLVCTSLDCSTKRRFGDIALEQYGNSTDDSYKWFCVLIVSIIYVVMIFVVDWLMRGRRSEASISLPIRQSINSGNLSGAIDSEPLQANGGDLLTLPFNPVTLTFENISYKVMTKQQAVSNVKETNKEITSPKVNEITLLSNITGFFEPGTMTAMMGSTGAGKTTLLDVLAMRKNQGIRSGNIAFNGKSVIDCEVEFKSIMAYVEQFDALSIFCTARESIRFSARLRLPESIDDEALQRWVDNVLSMVELDSIKDRMIGSAIGGMSFEQRKRVSIAFELAANPSIMFLDEPTTGLDSGSAETVVQNIRTIANSGRTVVCTIHQPSPSVFYAFDKLLLLKKGGQIVYFGDIGNEASFVVKYFESIPTCTKLHESSSKQNPATWILECIGAGTLYDSDKEKESLVESETIMQDTAIVDYANIFSQSKEFLFIKTRLNELISCVDQDINSKSNEVKSIHDAPISVSWWLQVVVIGSRTWKSYWRNPAYNLITRIIMYFILSLVFASAYVQFECHNISDVMAFVTILLMASTSCSLLAMQVAITVAMEERPVFYREQQSHMYSALIYTIIQGLVEIPFLVISSFMLTLPFFYIVGLDQYDKTDEYPVAAKYFYFWILVFLTLAFNVLYGQFLVAVSVDSGQAQTFASFSMSIFSVFSGFTIRSDAIPYYWRFVYWANPFHYSLEGVIKSQFHLFHQEIILWNGQSQTAEALVTDVFPDWKFSHLHQNIFICVLFLLSAYAFEELIDRW